MAEATKVTKKKMEQQEAPAGLQTKAQSKSDADSMSADQQLWDSLSYSYGQKKQASDQQFAKAINDQDNALLSRGMQRSSYGMATLGNLRNEQIKANSQIDSEMIADYENRLQQARKDELEQSNWERQFAEGQRQYNTTLAENQRQYNTNMEYQRGRDTVADQQWEKTFEENQRQYDTTLEENRRQYNQTMAENQRQYDTSMAENQRQYDTTFGENQRQYDTTMAENQRQYDTTFGENQRQYDTTFGENQRQYDTTLAENQRQYDTSLENTKYEFEQTQKAEEKSELRSLVTTMLENGVMPSQGLLDEVGISYSDASAWANKNSSSSGGSNKSGTQDTGGDDGGKTDEDATINDVISSLSQYQTSGTSTAEKNDLKKYLVQQRKTLTRN